MYLIYITHTCFTYILYSLYTIYRDIHVLVYEEKDVRNMAEMQKWKKYTEEHEAYIFGKEDRDMGEDNMERKTGERGGRSTRREPTQLQMHSL